MNLPKYSLLLLLGSLLASSVALGGNPLTGSLRITGSNLKPAGQK